MQASAISSEALFTIVAVRHTYDEVSSGLARMVVHWPIMTIKVNINSLPASGDLFHLLIIFANSLNPHQAGQKVWPDVEQKQ